MTSDPPPPATPHHPGPVFAEVAVPVPLRRTFTYRVPETLVSSVHPGSQVHVPFSGRSLSAFVVALKTSSDHGAPKDISGVAAEDLSLPESILDLGRWVAEYYLAPIGEVLRSALPAGLGKRTPESIVAEPGSGGAVLELSGEQQTVLTEILGAVRSRTAESFLLHGITGSGKTEVYLRAAEECVRGGGRALILIPEIALSPQMLSRVEARFGNRVALWHSSLPPARRRAVWTRTRRGEIDVLVGARSAVFAPLQELRLIVVDEEHEPAYKQGDSPRYHARDVALVRGKLEDAVVVLGSATPSLESYANAGRGKHRLLELSSRVGGGTKSRVRLLPLPRKERGKSPPMSPIFSEPLIHDLAETLSRGEQSILFLNRRGHSTLVQCSQCRTAVRCRNCDIVLTYHAADDRLRCHYCGAKRARPDRCPETECSGSVIQYRGVGTQKVEGELARLFAGARVDRLDTDTARRRGTVEKTLERFRNRETDILLGTQMVAKGLDFPHVTLVGVINADTQLVLPDFRSPERTFQLLTQVAGRAGRSVRPGKVVFQTAHEDHYALLAAAAQDYRAFFEEEMKRRGEGLDYPPHRRMVALLFDGRREEQVVAAAESLGAMLREQAEIASGAVTLMGPAPQPITRLKNQHRWHLGLRGSDHRSLRTLAERALVFHESTRSRVRLVVDVDPVSLL